MLFTLDATDKCDKQQEGKKASFKKKEKRKQVNLPNVETEMKRI